MKTDGCNKITCRCEICDAYAFGAPIKVVVPSFATFVVKQYLQTSHMFHTDHFKTKNSSFHLVIDLY
jgi:hypothetical protein